MKIMQWLVAVAFVLAGIALLCAPVSAQGVTAKAFVPTRFTVVDAGTVGKPDIVLIPGLASSRTVWDAEAKLLAPNYRLHLVQVDGFAGAPAGVNATGEILPGVLQELHSYIAGSGMHPVVIGHSLGGLLTLMLADRYPADLRKAVIVDSLPFYAVLFNPAATVEMMKPIAGGIKAQMAAMPADQYVAAQQMMAAGMAKSAEGQKAAIAGGTASDRAVVAEAMAEDMETDMRPEMASIKTPTLMLYEYDASSKVPDPVAYEKLVKDGYATMPNVTLVRMDDSKHFIMYDQPAKFDAALEGFLK